MNGPGLTEFRLVEVGGSFFVAHWRTAVLCRCRIQFSTSRSMVDARWLGETPGTEFTFDSRGTALDHLPAMGRYFVRVLAEDANGRQQASEILEVLAPEGDAIRNVRAIALGPDAALVEWHSAEPTIGQAVFRAADGAEIWTPFEPCLRTYHCLALAGLTPGTRYEVRIRQGLEREKWADQFLRSAPRVFTTPAAGDPAMGVVPGGEAAYLRHGRLRLLVDARGGLRVFLDDAGQLRTLLDQPPGQAPFSITLADGRTVAEFGVDARIRGPQPVSTEFGAGWRIEVSGQARVGEGVTLERTIQVEQYPAHPDAAVFRLGYRVCGDAPLPVAAVDSLSFRLDRRLALQQPERAEAWHLAGYLPVSHRTNFGETYTVVRLRPGFARENRLAGDGKDTQHNCGVPLFDFWCRQMGLAIGHLNHCQIPVSFPVAVSESQVAIGMRDERVTELSAQAPYQSPPLLLAVHTLDFFDAVSRFRELMAARGLQMPEPPAAAYEPVWSTWGYGQSFTKDDVRRALPLLKELGVRWVQLDDPWYANHGDMEVNRRLFPGGDDDLAAFVRELNAQGFRVRLWTCTGHASSGAPYARQFPARLIRGRDGQPLAVHSAGAPAGATEHELCPCLAENREFMLAVIERCVAKIGAAGLYQDGVYGCPPCHAADHGHADPHATLPAHAELYRQAYERIMKLTGGAGVVMLCACGKVPDFYLLPWTNRLATADPMPVHVRQRVKSHKALLGPRAAVDFDFVELALNDFASAVGTGSALYLKFTVPLEDRELARYRKWLRIAREHDLARGEYLNLYDLAHDYPEGHAVRTGARLYYAFYASPWAGDFETPFRGGLELRGLAAGMAYRLWDYVNERELGRVCGPIAQLETVFQGSLLFCAEPV